MFGQQAFSERFYVPTFEIKVDEKPLSSEVAKRIMDISIVDDLASPSSFRFRINDPELNLIEKNKGIFNEGKLIEIALGYRGQKERITILGEITELTPDFPNSGPATVEIAGFDLQHRLTRGEFNRTWEGITRSDLDIVRQIANESKLKFLGESNATIPDRNDFRTQLNQSNLAFVNLLAQQNNCYWWVEGTTLFFKKERPENKVTLKWGQTLMSFSPRLSTAARVNTILVSGYDQTRKEEFPVKVNAAEVMQTQISQSGQNQIANDTENPAQRIIKSTSAKNAYEAEQEAKGELAQEVLVSGTGSALGNPDIRAGTVLELLGLGHRFNDSYQVSRVTHSLGESGYQVSFEVNSGGNSGEVNATAHVNSVSVSERQIDTRIPLGVHVGKVTDNKEIGTGIISVVLLGTGESKVIHKARLTTLMAGKDRGAFFLPEIGDEVLLAFEQGNNTSPYILGALWNGVDLPPDTNSDGDNNVRFIKSRSGHLIRLDDSEGKEKIEIIDKTGKSFITIDSATNTLSIKSSKNINIEADGVLTLKGSTVNIN